MQRSIRALRNYALPVAMVAGLMLVYLTTMAPGLSWANGGSDGGDLIAAAATRGVAHPTGYPVYLWLARLFQLLPVGSLAFRTNLLSAVAMAGACLCIYLAVRRSVSGPDLLHRDIAGAIAGWAFGTSELAWSQAVITEVYALHAFFVALLLYLLGDPALAVRRARKVYMIGLILGLALGNHMTMLLLAPGILLSVALTRKSSEDNQAAASPGPVHFACKDLIRWMSGVGLGLSVYFLLPYWASARPAVNWGNPVTPASFWWLVSGKLYQAQMLDAVPANLFERLQDWAELLLRQYEVLGLLLAFLGLIVLFVPNRIYLVSTWTAVSLSVFAISYQVADWYMLLTPVYLVFGIWLGFGLAQVFAAVYARKKMFGYLLGLICIGYIAASTAMTWSRVDASRDMRAETFGRSMMRDLPAHAIVFAEEDRTVFALWYFHYALRQRPDIFVIATDLLPFEWYRETLRHNYPDLEVPAPNAGLWLDALAASNSAYPACTVLLLDRAVMECSPTSRSP